MFVAARRLKVYLGGRSCRQLLTIKDFDLSMNSPSTSQRDLQHLWLLSKASSTKLAMCFTFQHGEQEQEQEERLDRLHADPASGEWLEIPAHCSLVTILGWMPSSVK